MTDGENPSALRSDLFALVSPFSEHVGGLTFH